MPAWGAYVVACISLGASLLTLYVQVASTRRSELDNETAKILRETVEKLDARPD